MSIDLAWDVLIQSQLASNLVSLINRQLSVTERPSFIGPVIVNSFDFGAEPPDVEIVDIRDIYRDFLEDDENEDNGHEPSGAKDLSGEDDFEWVSRKSACIGLRDDAPSYHHLPPHIRYGRGPATDPFGHVPLPMSVPNFVSSPGLPMSTPHTFLSRSTHIPSTIDSFSGSAVPSSSVGRTPSDLAAPNISAAVPNQSTPQPDPVPQLPENDTENENENEHPNLQFHLRITHHSNLRLTLTTSLLINYPSPSFMSLPIKLSVTGIVFTGEVVLAYEGSRKRVHLCILDDLDPYGPASDRSSRASSDPAEGKPLPIGMRLLPSILIESEIGQADKHVLKNVTKVERFIQDVIRKTVEEELLFPNYHTIVLGESS